MTSAHAASRHLRAVTVDVTPAAEPLDAPAVSTAATDDVDAVARAEIVRARAELPPLDPAAFDCFLGGLARGIEDWTEGDLVNVLVSLVCVSGVHLGQSPHVRAGDDVHPLLVWPLVIGHTNRGRKGAGWSSARRLVLAADPDFMVTNQRSGLTSGEGLAAMFTDDPDTPPADTETATPTARAGGRLPPGDRRLLVFEAEWAAVMARMKREGNSLSATLRGAWEGGDLSTLAVSARIAPSSHVGILAHITPGEFKAKVSHSDLAGGTYNRFLPVMVSRSKFLPGGQGAPTAVINGLGAELADRLRHGADVGTLGFTTAGDALWRRLYVEFGTDHGDTGQVEQFISRAAPNCLRIAAIHAALDGAAAIDARHLTAAAALVRYSIDSARAALGNTREASALLAWITEAGTDGRTKTDITKVLFKGHKTAEEIQPLLDQLTAAGRVTVATIAPPAGKGGRSKQVYIGSTANNAN